MIDCKDGKGLKSVISAECQHASFTLKRNWCYCVMESKGWRGEEIKGIHEEKRRDHEFV